jgi:hypothetical protein
MLPNDGLLNRIRQERSSIIMVDRRKMRPYPVIYQHNTSNYQVRRVIAKLTPFTIIKLMIKDG